MTTPTPTDHPTDKPVYTLAAINQMAAELIGYRVKPFYDRWLTYAPGAIDGTIWYTIDEAWAAAGDFCSSDCPHSLTAQLLAKVEEADRLMKTAYLIAKAQGMINCESIAGCVACLTASPLIVTVACLQACGKLPADMEIPTTP